MYLAILAASLSNQNMQRNNLLAIVSFFCFIFLFTDTLFSQNNFQISKLPNWVERIENNTPLREEDKDGSSRYLLVDYQNNYILNEFYSHFTIELFNSDGVQSFSDIAITYDPSFQKLKLHYVDVIRAGNRVSRLNKEKLKFINSEEDSDRYLYNEEIKCLANLEDIRKGDILDYSYTIVGRNKVFGEDVFSSLYQNYSSKVGLIFQKIISKEPLVFSYFNGAAEPISEEKEGVYIYSWRINESEDLIVEDWIPGWYDPYKFIQFSTFKSWEELVAWALPLYEVDESSLQKMIKSYKGIAKEKDRDKAALEAIRFVQDDIRYLGFEAGISGYKPSNPNVVINRRFGDCKDKSLVLSLLLRNLGIESYPILVNTSLGDKINSRLPSPYGFNHCIVAYVYNEKEYFIDPTISNQGGDLESQYVPNYKSGLRISEGTKDLTFFEEVKPRKIINDLIKFDSIGGSAKFDIETQYFGYAADNMRSSIASNTKEQLQNSYVDFYSTLYPNLEVFKDMTFQDDTRDGDNIVIVREYYKIPDFWNPLADTTQLLAEVYPLELASLVDLGPGASRKMPYYMGEAIDFRQTTTVMLPEEWGLSNTDTNISSHYYNYVSSCTYTDKKIVLKYNYTRDSTDIIAEEVSQVLSDHSKILDDILLQLTYNKNVDTFKLSWYGLFLFLISLIGSFIICYKIYHNYDPEPQSDLSEDISGWMVLPLIGLIISFISLLYNSFIDSSLFNANVINNLVDLGWYNYLVIISFEEFVNRFLMVAIVFLLILFFKKRSSLPRLMMYYFTYCFVILVIDYFASCFFLEGQSNLIDHDDIQKEIFRSIVVAGIWIPFFYYSQKVKNTFTVRK